MPSSTVDWDSYLGHEEAFVPNDFVPHSQWYDLSEATTDFRAAKRFKGDGVEKGPHRRLSVVWIGVGRLVGKKGR